MSKKEEEYNIELIREKTYKDNILETLRIIRLTAEVGLNKNEEGGLKTLKAVLKDDVEEYLEGIDILKKLSGEINK